MLPVQPAAQTLKAQAPSLPLTARARALAMLAEGAEPDWVAMRADLRKALAASEQKSGRLHSQSLTLRALAGLVLDRQGEDRGLRIFAEACGNLHRQLRSAQRVHGAEAKEAIPYLEALLDLYRLEKLRVDRWEDLHLRIALRQGGGPRPDLEKQLVAAVERHYGPFLSFRPPDRGAVLEDVAMLLPLWSRREPPQGPSRAFAETGFRSDARGVWKLVAAHADESLRGSLKAFVASLDAEVLQEQLAGFLAWLPGQASSPWQAEARARAEAVDAWLEKAKQPTATVLKQRVRLARAMGENDRAVRLIIDAFREPWEDRSALLGLAEEQLKEQTDPVLVRLLHEALLADLPWVVAEGPGRSLLVAEAQRLEAAGDLGAAENFWRSLLAPPAAATGVMGPGEAEHALGDNLAAQQRWEEARFFLEPLTASEKWGADPALRLQLAAVESGRGDREAAKRRARQGLALLPTEEPIRPLPGLAAALKLLADDPQSQESVEGVLERVRLALDPEGLVPLLKERSALLALLEGLERRGVKPPVVREAGCGGPWAAVGSDSATRGMALLQAALGLRLEDAEPCLREALRNLEQAYSAEDSRLLLPLMRLARCLQDREDPGAEALYRRILAIAATRPEADPMLELEARARLGQLLSEQGRDEAADALLRTALGRLLKVAPVGPKQLEMIGGVVLMLVARLEYREDYLGAAEILEQAESLLTEDARIPGTDSYAPDLRELTAPKVRFVRQAKLQTLLRAQGLP